MVAPESFNFNTLRAQVSHAIKIFARLLTPYCLVTGGTRERVIHARGRSDLRSRDGLLARSSRF